MQNKIFMRFPCLKQWIISLLCSQDGDVPLLAQTLSGESSDKTHFRQLLGRLKNEAKSSEEPVYYVADSALYSAETLNEISESTHWITQVPETLKSAKEAIAGISKKEMQPLDRGYAFAEIGSIYGGIKQRWIVVFSEKAFHREEKTLRKRIAKEVVTYSGSLNFGTFSCRADADKAARTLQKKLRYHRIEVEITEGQVQGKRGRPKKGTMPTTIYKAKGKLIQDQESIQKALDQKGTWIIATNDLDREALSSEDLLANYKSQQSVERGFRFLKDPLFMTSSVFLKNSKRIVALSM